MKICFSERQNIKRKWNFYFKFIILLYCYFFKTVEVRVCKGSNTGLNIIDDDVNERIKSYVREYANCTVITLNVEIILVREESVDTSFLDAIEEVNGYILIFGNDFKHLSMKNLKLVRGEYLYLNNSIHIEGNNYLSTVNFESLAEVMKGSLTVAKNPKLCFLDSINWNDIFYSNFNYFTGNVTINNECSKCPPGCSSCWTESICQKIRKLNCQDDCLLGCLEEKHNSCCHVECAGGCFGKYNNCTKCRNYNNNGKCVERCPPKKKYDPQTKVEKDNPNGTYQYGNICVEKCPDETVLHNEKCLTTCPAGYVVSENGENRKCHECQTHMKMKCPKTCKQSETINKNNVQFLKDCTIIDGDIMILAKEIFSKTDSIVSLLNETFFSVEEITGVLVVQGKHENFTDLSCFKNLKVVRGSSSEFKTLEISRTSLRHLGLTSLTKIAKGDLKISDNEDLETLDLISLEKVEGSITVNRNQKLCYTDISPFTNISSDINFVKNGDLYVCEQENKTCHQECYGGCWGPGNKRCKRCFNYNFYGECIHTCEINENVYKVGSECKRCHSMCLEGCHGSGPANCTKCIKAKNGIECVDKCPEGKYLDKVSKICHPCDQVCKNGCSGPSVKLENGGCNNCFMLMNHTNSCLNETTKCNGTYYQEHTKTRVFDTSGHDDLSQVIVCYRCNPLCKSCSNGGIDSATCNCTHVEYSGICYEICPPEYYKDSQNKCKPCHTECDQCYGPTEDMCSICKHVRVYLEILTNATEIQSSNQTHIFNVSNETDLWGAEIHENFSHISNVTESGKFVCNSSCPSYLPVEVEFYSGVGLQRKCSEGTSTDASKLHLPRSSSIIIGSLVMVGLIVLCIFVIVFAVLKRQKAKAEENKVKLQIEMEGLCAEEILTPTNVRPDLSSLRLIKESELVKGEEIGSGAFGTVYKGIWHPENEKVKVAVAIKVLIEGSSRTQHKELLEEARVMASVSHPCCIRILAVCLAKQMMLVTPLVVYGSLLHYIRKNKENLGSHSMLKWATQIARGMNYLEKKGIVHRDLAARNILVQGKNQIKITDFGLAKLLDADEETYLSHGEKVPVKWLALESIQRKIFTHKSDVWSYGITLWELFTFGQRPYETVNALDMAEHLEMGERLPQPGICTIDVYMIMIKCWIVNAESRPSFQELESDFSVMSRDPGRFLVIPGDDFLRTPSDILVDDKKELIRQMNLTDNDDDLMCGEDYLDPVESFSKLFSRGFSNRSNRLTSFVEEEETSFQTVGDYAHSRILSTERGLSHQSSSLSSGSVRVFANLEAASAARKGSRQRKSSARYQTSPNKVESDELKILLEPPRLPSIDEKELMKLELLTESCCCDDNNNNDESVFYPKENQKYENDEDYLVPRSKSKGIFIDNPEYLQQEADATAKDSTGSFKVNDTKNNKWATKPMFNQKYLLNNSEREYINDVQIEKTNERNVSMLSYKKSQN